MRIFCIVNFSNIIFSKSAGGNSFYSERSSPNFASNVKWFRGNVLTFVPPWNHQKTHGFLIVSGGTEVNN